MIDTNKLDKISYTNKIVEMYEELNTEIIRDVIRKLKEVGNINSYTRSQLRVIAKRGGIELFKSTLLKTSKLSKKRKKELLQLFAQIINEDLMDYRDLYEYRNLEMTLSITQQKILAKMIRQTDHELQNYNKTVAFVAQTEFVNATDKMYQQVVTNGIDFQTAFRKTTNLLASKGITLPMSNGYNRSIEAAVRQNVLYGIRETAQLVENDLIDYLGADAVEFNITPNCRHTHIPINGKIFSLDKNNKKYPYFKPQYEELLQDYGCQHYKSPFIIGVSEPINTPEEIKKADNKTVRYKGEKIPYYDATQKQRALERNIRNAKKMYMSNPNKENKMLILNEQRKIREFIGQTKLQRDYSREYFAGYNN